MKRMKGCDTLPTVAVLIFLEGMGKESDNMGDTIAELKNSSFTPCCLPLHDVCWLCIQCYYKLWGDDSSIYVALRNEAEHIVPLNSLE